MIDFWQLFEYRQPRSLTFREVIIQIWSLRPPCRYYQDCRSEHALAFFSDWTFQSSGLNLLFWWDSQSEQHPTELFAKESDDHWCTISNWQLLLGSKHGPFETTLSHANVAVLRTTTTLKSMSPWTKKRCRHAQKGRRSNVVKRVVIAVGLRCPKLVNTCFLLFFLPQKTPQKYSTFAKSGIQQNDSKFCFGAHQFLNKDRSWHCSLCILGSNNNSSSQVTHT